MILPEITLPKIDLPFDIPVFIHPSVDHFAIALPVVILLLEFYNLFAKRKSIGVFSFILLILTIVIFTAAYLTGVVDGKEAYDLLPQEGQAVLKEHKLLGTYLLLGSVLLLFLKLLAMTGKKLLKVLFFIGLIGFILVSFEQGEEGGKLVYKYGANVERVKNIDDKLFDTQEALEELQEKKVSTKEEKSSDVQVDKKKEISTSVVSETRSIAKKTSEIEATKKDQVKNEPIIVPSSDVEKALEVESTQKQEVNTFVPTSLKTESTNESTSVAQVEDVPEEIMLNPVPKYEEVKQAEMIKKEAMTTEVQKINSPSVPEVPAVPEVGETDKTYKESLEGLISDIEKFKIQTSMKF